MHLKLKKLIILLALTNCCTETRLFADDTHTQTNQYSIAPAKNPLADDTLPFYIQAAYTYWVPYQEGMNLAYSGHSGTASIPGNIIRPNIEVCNGFKVAIGANTMHDGWMVGFNYTWFNNAPAMAANPLIPNLAYRQAFDGSSNHQILELSSKWSNQFNRIDGQLDRSFYAGHYLAFRPWLGLLGAWDTQNVNANDLEFEGQIENVNKQVRWEQNWWGIGPYAGCEASYYFTNNCALYISSGGAMLLANHCPSQAEYKVQGATVLDYDFNLKNSFYNVEPMIETSLGLRWESFWTKWALCIDLSWELQTYFSHNGFQSFQYPMGIMGKYSMQGLTAGVKISV